MNGILQENAKQPTSINSHPAHNFRICEILPFSAHFPDTHIVPAPVFAHVADQPANKTPHVVRDGRAVLVVEVHGVQELTVDVQLEVVIRTVSNPHGSRSPIPFQMRQLNLGQFLRSVNAIHDL
ncbi:hypothetical protein BC938DRAFT_483821 [Jimgerdemannia flammicorona]|uniref:Uncharacterized protein n=1 Tax=Jimgerdemannia flammicorona TaxID=994334 RepID=A0A433QB69_9FUNG|nr:hypothetical protein BC938DRAFT_483821 [Jimgerdemannia flammicorona]